MLAAIAWVTTRIRLSTSVVIAPLRPAVLLAKQLATLDVISRGRVTIGLGVGWQKEEYEAAGVPWEGRYARFDRADASLPAVVERGPGGFPRRDGRFEKIHAFPRPVQKGGIPIWLGVSPSDRNIERMAELADGWIPMEQDPVKLAPLIKRIRGAVAARGRDPAAFTVRVVPRFAFGGGGVPDLEATLAVPDLVAGRGRHGGTVPRRSSAADLRTSPPSASACWP